MKFGKLADISGVDFSLPAVAEIPAFALPAGGAIPVYIGATGWSMPEWTGRWYPAGTQRPAMLSHYGKQFGTIELNTTHYRIPTPQTIDEWYAVTPADFRFCPKVPQRISHERNLGIGGDELRLFTDVIAGLAEKMGCAFAQLPPYFGTDRLGLLERFLQAWPRTLPLAIEVRHESWFAAPGDALNRLADLLEKYGVALVITDVAGRRDVLHLRLTAPRTLIRFVGNGLHRTDYERIDAWVERLATWRLPETYFFPHEPDNVLAPDMAAYLAERLHAAGGFTTRGPQPISAPNGGQLDLF
jgi:uncharacterized protein YecE (DUF72 family)